MTMKKSIIIYADCIAILEELTYEQAGRLFKAILAYVNDEPVTEIDNDPAIRIAYVVLKKQIDRDTEKYDVICKKRSEAGKRHRGNQYTKNGTNGTNGTSVPKMEQMEQNGTNGTDNVNENDNDSDNESTNVDNLAPNGALSSGADDAINFDNLVSFFNKTLEKFKSVIPVIKDIKGKRRDSVRARARERGKKSLVVVFENAAKSDYLNGRNDKSFIANFDWLVRPNNFIKVLEGNYNNKSTASERTSEQYREYQERIRREEEERERSKEGAVTREEYLKMKEAGELLNK